MGGAPAAALACLLAWLGLAEAPARAAVPPGFLHETLGNGLLVSILPQPDSPVVATQLFYHVGAAHEPARQAGLAHLLEHLMFRGESSELDAFVTRHGGYVNAYTAPDETVYVSEIAPEHHGRLLELEAARLGRCRIAAADLDRERRIVAEEQRLRFENDPVLQLGVQGVRRLLGAHPYNHIGTEGSIGAIGRDLIERFCADHYRPERAHLVIVGPVDGPAVLGAVRRLFSALPAGGPAPPLPEVPPLLGWRYPEELELSQPLAPVKAAALLFPLPPRRHPDYDALRLLRQLLARGEGNLVGDELVRRRREAVVAGAALETVRQGGALALYAAYLPYRRKGTALRLLFEVRERLGRMDWLTERSLRAAKRALRQEELRRRYSAREQAQAIGEALYHLGDVRRAFTEAERLEAVTLPQVQGALSRYVLRARPLRLYARPERVPWWMTLFGWLYPLVMR